VTCHAHTRRAGAAAGALAALATVTATTGLLAPASPAPGHRRRVRRNHSPRAEGGGGERGDHRERRPVISEPSLEEIFLHHYDGHARR
jgi:hypothetical protein